MSLLSAFIVPEHLQGDAPTIHEVSVYSRGIHAVFPQETELADAHFYKGIVRHNSTIINQERQLKNVDFYGIIDTMFP